MCIGGYLLHTEHSKAHMVVGLCVCFMAFVLMPIFIYYRYKNGKYRKYILNDEKIKQWRKP